MVEQDHKQEKGKIIGIGGIFFKSYDPVKLTNWYRDNLGFSSQTPYMEGDDAITIKWKSWEGVNENTVWAPFPKNTKYMFPSEKPWMVNYIVQDIEDLLARLARNGINQLGDITVQPFGKFAQILDPEGNKIEFWEPNRNHFKDIY
ncbi:MAG: VOC family protein [Candidatus Kariarchaeaceae archaeon]|jgi:hypothetical protein